MCNHDTVDTWLNAVYRLQVLAAADAVPTTRTILVIAIVTALFLQKQTVKGLTPISQSGKASVDLNFHWDWTDSQELSAVESLQTAKLTHRQKVVRHA
jgi:hypothetical protein